MRKDGMGVLSHNEAVVNADAIVAATFSLGYSMEGCITME
jgi:hypothetical protein